MRSSRSVMFASTSSSFGGRSSVQPNQLLELTALTFSQLERLRSTLPRQSLPGVPSSRAEAQQQVVRRRSLV